MSREPNATLLKHGWVQRAGEPWEAPEDVEVFATRDELRGGFLVRVRPGLIGRVEPRWVRPFWGANIPSAEVLDEDTEP